MAATQRPTNVEIVRGLYDPFNEGDLETVLAAMADDIEWTEPAGCTSGGTYVGPDEIREKVFEVSMREFDPFVVEPERFIDGGDTVVVLGVFHATTQGTEIESPFAHVLELKDGKVTRFENYTDTALWQ
ncbi:nuclear transport factor 2 family protein [Haloarchaeobius sp. DFWS5]|uniref:nuclear transport factor 2 family protein n=1 Tax=Haloarchaeobius sp. DFWS5 TaxID=3446114 RepID=UPI003EBE8F3B